ncbi:hypothetical protein HanHA89_Chr02g0070231 [Helianthus annuus]|nr:hypothetical protein HanHA89_Chr02g0070231 [Helianthus annuus]
MDPSMLAYAHILGMSPQPFFHGPHGFAFMGGSQPSQEQTKPDVETVPETEPEPVAEESQRGKRSHKKGAKRSMPESNLPSLVER